MPFGPGGFFRDRAYTAKPVALDVTFVRDRSAATMSFGAAQNLASAISVNYLQALLWAEGIGVTTESRPSTFNRFSQVDNRLNLNVFDPIEQRPVTWPVTQQISSGWDVPVDGTVIFGSGTQDVTGGAYGVAVTDPRVAGEPDTQLTGPVAYRTNVARVMLSISATQSGLTHANDVVQALTTRATAQSFIGVGSFEFVQDSSGVIDPDTGLPIVVNTSNLIGAVLRNNSDKVFLAFYTGASLPTFVPAFLDSTVVRNTHTNEIVTVDQIINGPVVLPSGAVNMPHLAYKTSGAVFDIGIIERYLYASDVVTQAVALALSRYLYETLE